MTYYDICERLQNAGIEHADTEASLLLAHFCGVRASELPFRRKENFDCAALCAAVERRTSREPLQYLLGEWEFFGLPFTVNPSTLIPRPDTEILVEQALALVPRGARFADFCTGSGCIAAAVLVHRPDTSAVLVDAFAQTLDTAKQNCAKNGVQDRAQFVLRDLLCPLDSAFEPKFDCILSNPPYIPTQVVKGLAPELAYEPQVALDGGADGMLFYRHFLSESEKVLKDQGFWLFEIGYDQEKAICSLASELGFTCTVERDLGGNPRVAIVRKMN